MTVTLTTGSAGMRLCCRDCDREQFALDEVYRLERHTMRVHFRVPTREERIPKDTILVRPAGPAGSTFEEILDHLAVGGYRLVVDDDGRRWALPLSGWGCTRIDGEWRLLHRAEPLSPGLPVPAGVSAWLDGWDAAHPSDDFAPPAGIPRPVSQLISMGRGL